MNSKKEECSVSKEKIAEYLNVDIELYKKMENGECEMPLFIKEKAKSMTDLTKFMRSQLIEKILYVFDNMSLEEQIEIVTYLSRKGSDEL